MSSQRLQIEIEPEKLAQLFRLGVLCPADLQCLDTHSRDQIHKLCLKTCAQALCDQCQHSGTCPMRSVNKSQAQHIVRHAFSLAQSRLKQAEQI